MTNALPLPDPVAAAAAIVAGAAARRPPRENYLAASAIGVLGATILLGSVAVVTAVMLNPAMMWTLASRG